MEAEPDTSVKGQPGRDPKTGLFLPGHEIPRLAKERRAEEYEAAFGCPVVLVRRGLGGLWDLQVAAAKKGSVSALAALWALVNKYADEPQRASAEASLGERYAGLPDEVGQVLRELDVGIAEVVHRGTLGLPMSDVEQLIFETAQAIQDGGPKCAAVTRWRGVLIHEIQTLREQKGTDDVKEQGTQGICADVATTSATGDRSATGAHDDNAAGNQDDAPERPTPAQAHADDCGAGREPVDAG